METSAARRRIPVGVNLWAGTTLASVNLFALLLLPVLMNDDVHWVWLLVPVVGLTTTYWSLIHEAVHGVLLPGRRWNELSGRLLAVIFGSPFRVLRFGHMMHHRLNRTDLDQTEVYNPKHQSLWRVSPVYYFRVLIGLYAFELAASILVFLPRRLVRHVVLSAAKHDKPELPDVAALADRQILERPALGEIRKDSLLILTLYGTSFWLYGTHAAWLVLLLLARGFLISFFDNAYHYGCEAGNIRAGYNLRLPTWASRLILNFNYHQTHHRHPALPWSELPQRFAAEGDRFHAGYLDAAFRQLKGPIEVGRIPAPSD